MTIVDIATQCALSADEHEVTIVRERRREAALAAAAKYRVVTRVLD